MAIIHIRFDRFIHLSAAALVVAALTTAGIAQNAGPVLPPSAGVVSIMVTDGEPDAPASFAAIAEPAAARWGDIKDCTSDMRSAFFSGLGRLEKIVNNQIDELTARRATTKNPVDIKNLDLAIQNVGNAQFFLTAMGELLGKSTPQNWDKQKIKVGLAWVKTQEAYAKAKARTTG